MDNIRNIYTIFFKFLFFIIKITHFSFVYNSIVFCLSGCSSVYELKNILISKQFIFIVVCVCELVVYVVVEVYSCCYILKILSFIKLLFMYIFCLTLYLININNEIFPMLRVIDVVKTGWISGLLYWLI